MSGELWMLDTNAVSTFMHARNKRLDREIAIRTKSALCISTVSYGETLYGLSIRPGATRLAAAAARLFTLVEIMAWSAEVARRYGSLRADLRRAGKALQPLDMLIAAHAVSLGATLISSDRAFRHVPDLNVEDWTA